MEKVFIVLETIDSDGINVTTYPHRTLEGATKHLQEAKAETIQMLEQHPINFELLVDSEKEYYIEDTDGDFYGAEIREADMGN